MPVPVSLQDLIEAAAVLPDPNTLPIEDMVLYDGSTMPIRQHTRQWVKTSSGKVIQFNVCSESGKGSRLYWSYNGGVDVGDGRIDDAAAPSGALPCVCRTS